LVWLIKKIVFLGGVLFSHFLGILPKKGFLDFVQPSQNRSVSDINSIYSESAAQKTPPENWEIFS
jgi:hypothetical protein